MKIKIQGRGTGKTMGIVNKLQKDKHAVVIVAHMHAKHFLLNNYNTGEWPANK